MLFALGTTNTPKTNAIREALDSCPYLAGQDIQILGYKVASGVSDMPLSLADLRNGAKNRAQEVRRLCPEADYFVGMEAGVYKDSVGEESWLMGAVYIEDREGEGHYGYTCHIPVPQVVMRGLHDDSGRDIDQIIESLGAPAGTSHSCGSFGMWTDMMLSRGDQFRLATQCAIAPFFNEYYSL